MVNMPYERFVLIITPGDSISRVSRVIMKLYTERIDVYIYNMGFEINLDDTSIVEIAADEFEIEIPSYFNCLDSTEINMLSRDEKCGQRIIGCGRSNNNGNIDLLTNDGKLLSISSKKYNIPPGRVTPTLHGLCLNVDDAYTVDSRWIIDHAEPLITT